MGTGDIKAIVNQQFETTVRDLKNLVTIPGIAWDSFDQEHLRRSASAVKALVDCLAFDTVEILRASYSDEVSGTVRDGAPAVVATKKAAEGRPTVLLYAHHDVQPPQDAGLWDTPPFEPAERQGRLFGRGAADDKAGVMLHIAAVRALEKAIGKDHGLGIKLFIEGEEEAGSPSFARFLDAYAERLAADIIVVADSANWDVGTPALTTSLRGLVDGTFEVRVLEHAVHSGMFGGIVLDPLVILSKLIATLHDEKGNVAIAGLASYDASGIDFEEGKLRKDSSVLPGVRLAGEGSFTSRLWTKPALTIIGIDAPATAEASNTLLPSAKAKFSLRLAPGQDPRQAMEAVKTHMERHMPYGAELVFRPGSIGEPFKMDVESSPTAALALKNLSAAWGSPAVEVGIGGSIPFIADLKRVFPHAQVLITGVEDPDSRAHSANESLHLGEYKKAVTAESLLLAELAALQAEDVLPAGGSLRIDNRN